MTRSWIVFAIVVVVCLVADLAGHRGDRTGGRRQAIGWSAAWICVSLLFAGWVGLTLGTRMALDFLTAYVVEKSLSVDNLLVFLVIFGRLRIPRSEQHRVLFWGILGAFVTRAIFIGAGATVLSRWHYATYVLGAFLLYTGARTMRTSSEAEAKEGRVIPFLQRHLPFTPRLHGHRFLVVEEGKKVATPLLLALIAIEITDIMFAVDSIPAVFAISSTPFIVFGSNVFAILGLRALYLVIAELVADLKYLHYGLGGVLIFIGAKMLASKVVHLPHWASLAVTLLLLGAAIVPSLVARHRRRRERAAAHDAPT